MSKRLGASGVVLVLLVLTFDTSGAGEFVTQGLPAQPGHSVPYCSSSFGCFLEGVTNPMDSKLIPDRTPGSPIQEAPVLAAPPADLKLRPTQRAVIAADPADMDGLKRLVALAPNSNVRIVASNAKTSAKNIDFYVVTALDPTDIRKSSRLFEAQLHIIAAANIRSLSDLTGKVVSLGPDKSPTQVVAREAFAALGIPVQETPLDLDNALDGLSTGDVEAVAVLAPAPIARFEALSTPGLHLMSWPDGVSLPAGAKVSSIDPSAYPGLVQSGGPIAALGVDAVLKKNPDHARLQEDETSLAAQLRGPRDAEQ